MNMLYQIALKAISEVHGFITSRVQRTRVAFVHDIFMAFCCLFISLLLRVGEDIDQYSLEFLLKNAIVFTLVSISVFQWFKSYQGMWRYASLSDLSRIIMAVLLIHLIAFALLYLMMRNESLPRSIPFISILVMMLLLCGPRLLYRFIVEAQQNQISKICPQNSGIPVLLLGTDAQTDLILREYKRGVDCPYHILGLLSFHNQDVGHHIQGFPVLNSFEFLSDVLRQLPSLPQKIIISQKDVEPKTLQQVIEIAASAQLPVLQLPQQINFETWNAKPIDLEDLLGRPATKLDIKALQNLIHGKRILVTGAGGSIGSELCRQVAELSPKELMLLDHSEYLLYLMDLELGEKFPNLKKHALLANVSDVERIDSIFKKYKPEIVFHAAALKHVPLVESNPCEGVLTNVMGSICVANACSDHNVNLMVMISTDKAINPTSIMGATKRLAESYCQAMDIHNVSSKQKTRYVTVRFGNVIGSTGSVVPLFQRQILQGGPVTITHPEMVRYFMTIFEAVQLVLQAAAHGVFEDHLENHGKIYILDMGQPVRIIDLAKQMIRLFGLRPDTDIKINFTGLRPGEKLFEELFHHQEKLLKISVEGVFLISPRLSSREDLQKGLIRLEKAVQERNSANVLDIVRELVPEYQSSETLLQKPQEKVAS